MPVLRAGGTSRRTVLSAYGASATRDASWFIRFVGWAMGAKMRDKERMESLVRASDFDWTLVRPSMLSNGKASGPYRASCTQRSEMASPVSRADLAAFIVQTAARSEFIGQASIVTG